MNEDKFIFILTAMKHIKKHIIKGVLGKGYITLTLNIIYSFVQAFFSLSPLNIY